MPAEHNFTSLGFKPIHDESHCTIFTNGSEYWKAFKRDFGRFYHRNIETASGYRTFNWLKKKMINKVKDNARKILEDLDITDYTEKNMVQVADEALFQLLIKERLSLDILYRFDGDDTCKWHNCLWDGESRRCACDNRRVAWVRDYGWNLANLDSCNIHAEAW